MSPTSLASAALVLVATSFGTACANGGPETFFIDVDAGHRSTGDDAGDDAGDGGSAGNPQPQPQPTSTGSSSGSQAPSGVCAAPSTAANCHSCSQSSSKCQANGCYGGYLCDTQTGRCRPPDSCP